MRNLKKFLALVLAMMMTFSLMVTVNAATTATSKFTDDESITDEFSEGVAVLEGLKVFQGYADGTFKPKDNITRAEVATIVYRLATGDAAGTKTYLYEGGAKKFKDVPDDHWASGAIGYCANNLLVRGYDDVRFGPNDYVTGVQAITMILRAVGYGQGGEFEGWGWETRAYGRARAEGLLVNVDESNYSGKLTEVATRELVAELLFQAALIPQVTWTESLGYNKYTTLNGSRLNDSLGQENFRLDVKGWDVIDDWGNPGYKWYSGNTAIATIKAEPDMTFTDTKHECDIAHELEIEGEENFTLYLNGKTAITDKYRVVATDTTTKVGGQGRLTKVYEEQWHPWSKGGVNLGQLPYTVTMVDTFLAKVVSKTDARLDPADHVITPATLTLDVYDQPQDSATPTTPNPSTTVVSKKTTDKTNWDYNVGDMILLNAYTDHANGFDANGNASSHASAATEPQKNKAAFETETVAAAREQDTNAWVLHVADSKVAKQTTVYWNQGKHNVDGTDIPDQIDLFLDVAGTTTNSDFTWYFDDEKNIIGIGEAVKSNYGVITSLYSSFNTADGATNGEAVARAHVKYADGSEGDVIIAQFVVNAEALASGHAAGGTVAMVGAATPADGVFELKPVYDFNTSTVTGDTMEAMTMVGSYTPVNPVEGAGQLNVSPVASINATAEGNTNTNPYFGIIKDNLFKFVTAGDGKVSAIEVAGLSTNDTVYVNNYNGTFATDAGPAPTTAEIAARTLYKNGGYLAVNTPATTIRLDNNTQIMVLNDATKDITIYNGLSALPANIICKSGSEVDWSDYDGDGIAEVVYVTGEAAGSVAYGLFYYVGGAGQWNDTDKKGTLAGYLGGEAKTLTFTNRAEYDLVRNSNLYGGHLFGVRLNGDEVTNLMGVGTGLDAFLSSTAAPTFTSGTAVQVDTLRHNTAINAGVLTLSGAANFVPGVQGGNSYTAGTTGTHAIWLEDSGANITWNQYRNEIVNSAGGTYSLTGASKIVGDLAYLNKDGRINDVTIVYEDNAVNSIVEVYVTTEPDNTTPGVDPSTPSASGVSSTGDVRLPGATAAALETYLKTGLSNVAVYNPGAEVNGGANGDPTHLIYFPFSAPNTDAVTLTIRDSAGTEVYIENSGTLTAGGHFFTVNFANYWNSATAYCAGPFDAGTYTFTITSGTTVLSSGTFTLT